MKKIIVFAATTGVFVLIFLMLVVLRRESARPTGRWDTQRQCPLEVVVDGRIVGRTPRNLVPWEIFVSDVYGTGPSVAVDLSNREKPPGFDGPSCEFDISKTPGPTFQGVDWRIGHRFHNLAHFKGKTVTVSMMLKAGQKITFDTGAVYSYDGKNISYHPIGTLDRKWRKFVWDHAVPTDAIAFEIWLRLTIHGAISSTGSVYLSDVRVGMR